uniref:Tyrosine-protein kinase n=1 Tax=Caenorhabditis tropicalis TaxID=1561998 RepID=A0A1I7UXK7_9PELO
MQTQEDSGSIREKNKKTKQPEAAPVKKLNAPPPAKKPMRSMEPQEDTKEPTTTNNKKSQKSPSTPKTTTPSVPTPNKRAPNKPSREKFGQEKSVNRESREQILSKKRPSAEKNDKESASSPPKTEAAKEQKEVSKESASTYGSIKQTERPKTAKRDFETMEKHIYKMSNFHGYVCREDVSSLLKNSGDWLVRLSVQPSKEPEKKNSKGTSRDRTAKRLEDSRKKSALIFILTEGKTTAPGKSNNRNLVIKASDGKFSIDSIKWFMKIADLFDYYQVAITTHKGAEFQLLTPIFLSVWEFHQDDIDLLSKKLGEGAFGEVRVGRMTTKDPKMSATVVDVAVKMLKNAESVNREQVEELLFEARIMRRLEHKNVLRTYGVSVLREPLYLMSELCTNGALREYLKDNQKTITLADKLNFVLGSARGVEYIHSQKIIHRDLAVRNILLAEDKTPKVCDFGLSKLTDRYEMKEHCKIPVRYLAPETLELFVFTSKSDVFSFGCVIWEIYENGQQPHDGKNAQTIRAQSKKREFLKLKTSAPESLRELVGEKLIMPHKETPLPPNFVFSPHDKFYYAPATCNSMHYTTAAYVSAFIEFIVMGTGAVCFYVMSHKTESIDKWLFYLQAVITVLSLFSSLLMTIGISKEKPQFFTPKLTFITLEIVFLLFWAGISVLSMSIGIDFTRAAFGKFGKVLQIEKDYGPIWPFNVAVVSFFTAAIAIWTRIIVQGACDYLLDKEYFADKQNVELRESSKTR